MPPYLAGRRNEEEEFERLLGQTVILENLILTGLRGVGKTVLLETFKPKAVERGWLWVGTDLSESTSVNEQSLAIRLLTDLAVVTSHIVTGREKQQSIGFQGEEQLFDHTLNYRAMQELYDNAPGLVADKLKSVLELVWRFLPKSGRKGIIFAYDEAQNLSDHSAKEQYPLSLLLDVFQSLQKKEIPFFLILTGLPTLFPKLVEARTYSERMFRVLFLDRLTGEASREAIRRPVERDDCPVRFDDTSVDLICEMSAGYPYFLQFICREAYDVFLQRLGEGTPTVPIEEIIRKLDSDFFIGRWARATDRQRDLLSVAAQLEHSDAEFTVQDLVKASKLRLEKAFSSSHVNQMLSSLADAGLIYKDRHGKYRFAVPLLDQFILRQLERNPRSP